MAELRIGCADLPPRMSHAQYFRTLDFLETTLCLRGVPGDKVLNRWRTDAPARAYAVIAPRVLSADRLLPSDASLAVADRFATAVATLDAAAVVFRTPPEVTPSAANRDALRLFFSETASAERFAGRDRVWQPDGLWELGATATFARELDVLCVIDPLAQDPGVDLAPALIAHLERGAAYLRPTGMGRPRSQMAIHDLETIAALVEPLDRAYVVFANLESPRTARAFKKLAFELTDDGDPDDLD